jgi:hypothetical protein
MNLKLNTNTFLKNINNKKIYKKKLNNKMICFNKKTILKNKNKLKYYFIKFIINITIKKSNMFIHLMKCLGHEKYFYSIKSLSKKVKNLKFNNQLERFYKIIVTKFKFLNNKPISVYFNSTELNYKWFLNKISKKFFVINIKFFNKYSHNGCRNKKIKK